MTDLNHVNDDRADDAHLDDIDDTAADWTPGGDAAMNGINHCLIIVNRNGDARRGQAVLRRGLTEAQAVAICSDKRTAGRNWFIAHTAEDRLMDGWYWKDNGSINDVLAEYGVTWGQR